MKPLRSPRLALAGLVIVALGACSSGGHKKTASTVASTTSIDSGTTSSLIGVEETSTTTAAGPATTAKSSTVSTLPGSKTYPLAEADNGHAITVVRGDRIVITLQGTDWNIDNGSDPIVLRRDGATTYPSNTSTASFTAVGSGLARITATRAGGQNWEVDLTVN